MSGEDPFASPELKAALAFVQQHICQHMPPGAVDKAVLALAGDPPDEIETTIRKFVVETHHDLMKSLPNNSAIASVFPIAAARVLRDRLQELGSGGRA